MRKEEEKEKDIQRAVRESYGKIAKNKNQDTNCCGGASNCPEELSSSIGYSPEDVSNSPDGANMGLGCGNPLLWAEIQEGETVIDLGSGAGFDSFLASNKVGSKGMVIGVDITPEMVSKSRTLSREQRYENLDFRLGEIENLPIPDNTADVIISNCVINLSPQKQKVYKEAYRVLKEGGRLAIADVVLVKEPTEAMKQDERLYCG
jgi:arsenite methyltransferase